LSFVLFLPGVDLITSRRRVPTEVLSELYGEQMSGANKGLQQSALVMKILGWGLIAGLTGGLFLYPPGFLWGSHPATFPNIGPPHPESPLNALHPYLFMILSIYVAYGILLIRGAKDPKANAALLPCPIPHRTTQRRPRPHTRISSRSGKMPTLIFPFSSLPKRSTRSCNNRPNC
jgi:hypothetical protein